MKYLIRVDDYPRGTFTPNPDLDIARYRDFHAVFEEMGVPYCLGVVPALVTDDQIEYLQGLKNVMLAQHGFDHRVGFEHLSAREIKTYILMGKALMQKMFDKPEVYIPPFNELGRLELFDIVRECGFKIMTGGPESESVLLDDFTIRKLWGVLYVPSHRFLYNHGNKMIHTLDRIRGCNIAAITFHWGWEINNLDYLRLILERIRSQVISWENLIMSVQHIDVSQYPMKTSSRIPFKEIVETIRPGDKILDMGSSNSPLPALMAQKGCDVTAFDLSAQHLNEGLEHARRLGVEYAVFAGDFFWHDFPDGLDVITGCFSFGENPKYLGKDYSRNIDEVDSEFRCASTLLRKGGKLLLAVPFTTKEGAWVNYDRGDPMVQFTAIDIAWMLGTAGFKVNKIKYFRYDEGGASFVKPERALAMYVEAEKL